jgi:hypothetical protein
MAPDKRIVRTQGVVEVWRRGMGGCGHPAQPNASSSADSSGVPQTRQMTAEQSPQVRGSSTGRAQVGHQSDAGIGPDASECFASGMGFQRSSRGAASSSRPDRFGGGRLFRCCPSLAAATLPTWCMKRFVPDKSLDLLPTGYEIVVKTRRQSEDIAGIVTKLARAERRSATHVEPVTLYQPPLRLREDHDGDVFVRILIGPIRMADAQQRTFCEVLRARRRRPCPLAAHD